MQRVIFPCYENFNFGMLQPECSNMKANCLQIFALGALTSLNMWTTREKDLAKSLAGERKKLGQESGKQETSSHLSWCQNELRRLSWGNTGSLGKHTKSNTPRRIHVKKLGPGGIPTGSPLSPPTPGRRFISKPTGTILCTFFFFWVSGSQKLKMTVHIVVRVTALETIQKKYHPEIIRVDGNNFERFPFGTGLSKKRQLPLKIIYNLMFSLNHWARNVGV